MRVLRIIFLVWMLGACTSGSDTRRISTLTYYDINGLVDRQIYLLDSISPALYKNAVINGKAEKQLLHNLDSASWAKEIGIFKSADINLPILFDSYLTKKETQENSQVVDYTSKSPENTKVDKLQIVFNPEQNPILIKASLSSENALFTSQKSFELKFRNVGNISILEEYSIQGWQKMTTRDSTSFTLQGKMRIP